jgi:hypothetical protein
VRIVAAAALYVVLSRKTRRTIGLAGPAAGTGVPAA